MTRLHPLLRRPLLTGQPPLRQARTGPTASRCTTHSHRHETRDTTPFALRDNTFSSLPRHCLPGSRIVTRDGRPDNATSGYDGAAHAGYTGSQFFTPGAHARSQQTPDTPLPNRGFVTGLFAQELTEGAFMPGYRRTMLIVISGAAESLTQLSPHCYVPAPIERSAVSSCPGSSARLRPCAHGEHCSSE